MIETSKDLRDFLKADKEAMGLSNRSRIKDFLAANDQVWLLWAVVKNLRVLELRLNQYKKKKTFFRLLRYIRQKKKYSALEIKMGMYLSPNIFGPGINIVHPGYRWISSTAQIGKNCTILPRVLLGKKHPHTPAPCIFIGDDCYIGTGATILGPIHIGNNVTIAAGAVVVKDVPDNCVVAGNPATVIKYKTTEKKR